MKTVKWGGRKNPCRSHLCRTNDSIAHASVKGHYHAISIEAYKHKQTRWNHQ